MHKAIPDLETYEAYIEKYGTQKGIADHFDIEPSSVSMWYQKLRIKERVEKRLRR